MSARAAFVALVACASCGVPRGVAPAERAATARVAAAQRAFWRGVERGAVPDGKTAAEWTRELDPWLASTDPELRDDVAYTRIAGWIVGGRIEDDALRAFAAEWRADLRGEGTRDEDVLRRSFAALTLAAVAARELEHPFLGEDAAALRRDAFDYALRERDVRGHDATLGWVHATAHAADLLKFLARAPEFTPADQAEAYAVIDAKCAIEGAVWNAGEDLRLARIVLSIAKRPDFDATAFTTWIARHESEWAVLWSAPVFDGEELARLERRRGVLAEFCVIAAGAEVGTPLASAHGRVLGALAITG